MRIARASEFGAVGYIVSTIKAPGVVALPTDAAVEPWGRGSPGGRRLESEALNGELVRRGREYDIQTPPNFAIYAALRPYVDSAPALS